jgi:hypothetical protein
MFHRLLAICQRKQAEDAPCSLLTSVLNRNLFKQINEHMDMLKIASYVPVSLAATSAPTEASSADLAPFWQSSSSCSSASASASAQQYNNTNYMFVSSIEEDKASAASLFMPFFTLSSLSADGECAGGNSSSDSSDSSDNSDDFGYFEDEESFA